MNLLAKRAGLLLLAAVLFLLSCDDDSFLLGIKGRTKFQGTYHEIVFNGEKSSVLLLDSVYTDQFALSAPPISLPAYRFLIGEYSDPAFGVVRAELFAGFLPNDRFGIPTQLINPVSLDSATVQLLFDYYAYGPETTFEEEVLVYELADTLSFFTRYFNTSTVVAKTVPVARLTLKKIEKGVPKPITLTQLKYKEQLDRDPSNRDTLVLHGRLNLDAIDDDILGFEARLYNHLVSRGDSVLVGEYIPDFRKKFPGFAFIPVTSSKVLGFNSIGLNSIAPDSRVTIHYKSSASATPANLSLYFSPGAAIYANAFNNITTTRAGGLAGLSNPQERYFPYNDPASPERYIQDGSAAITELDLSDYYSFIDTLEDIVINSAELSMEVEDYAPGMSPIPSLYAVLMKKDGSKIVPLDIDIDADSLKMIQFLGNVYTDLNTFSVSSELSSVSPLTLSYDKNVNKYIGYATLFFQKLFDNKALPENNIEHIGFYPATAPILKILTIGTSTGSPLLESGTGNTVNRAVLKASGIKLKLYYTKPNKPNL